MKKLISNKWFTEIFVPSFGLCEDRTLSDKQADIFEKYLTCRSETRYAITYTGETINGFKIAFQRCGYNRKSISITTEENEILKLDNFDKSQLDFAVMALENRLKRHPERKQEYIDKYADALRELRQELRDEVEDGEKFTKSAQRYYTRSFRSNLTLLKVTEKF